MNEFTDFGGIEEKMSNGLFGCLLTWILEILPFLKTHDLYPWWSMNTHSYGQILPNLIQPKRVVIRSKRVETLTHLKRSHKYTYTQKECKFAHDLFFEYFAFSAEIEKRVESYSKTFFLDQHGQREGKLLGVHFRGTDKLGTEADFISIEDTLEHISGFLAQHEKEYATIFVITDEAKFLTSMIETFANRFKVLHTNARKSQTGKPLHFHESTLETAKEALVDSLLLSKCDFVIKTSSCLSDWVKIWNPDIEVYNLNRFRFDWFPQSIIPVKSFKI
jgi:hypothetical protein